MTDTSDNPGFTVNSYQDLVMGCHIFFQQYQIDNQIDLTEFKHRCDWVDIANNIVTYTDDLNNDDQANAVVQLAWTIYNS
jgi:hypothetical protein